MSNAYAPLDPLAPIRWEDGFCDCGSPYTHTRGASVCWAPVAAAGSAQSCGDPSDCWRDSRQRCNLPNRCAPSPYDWATSACPFYRPIREWAEKMPIGPGRWIYTLAVAPPMGFAPPRQCGGE